MENIQTINTKNSLTESQIIHALKQPMVISHSDCMVIVVSQSGKDEDDDTLLIRMLIEFEQKNALKQIDDMLADMV